MGSRLKEDERNERTIRNLLKLPENRRCINCNSLGPQYVCTSFWTFVCTTCSGIHREFTHRVKSVSMAKFTSQEVSALQGGGNASAKEIYFKEWDPQRQTFPDSSNVEKLRDFIKHVYVDRRYSGERSFDKPPRVKTGEAEDSFQGGSRSPPYENERRYSDRPSPGGRSDDRSSKNSYDERRSPGYDQDNRQYGDYGRSPARTEVVNDWRREDRFGNGRRSDDKMSDGGSKVEGRSPDRQRELDMSSPPMVRPVREILGESVSPLRVIEPPRANGTRTADGSLRTQRTASSSSLASSNGNPAELRTESSLIDFDAVPELPSTAPVTQTQQTAPASAPASASASAPFVAQPTSSLNDNWANFDSVPQGKPSQASSNANILDVLSELSVSASLPVQTSIPGGLSASVTTPGGPFFPSNNNPLAAPTGNVQVLHSGITLAPGGAAATPGQPFNAFANAADGRQWQNMHPPQNLLPANQPPAQSFNQGVGGSFNNQQPWDSSLNGNTQVPSSAPGAGSQVTSGVDAKPPVKRELPADLFTSSYSAFAAPSPGWYPAPQYGMGVNMQYNAPVAMPPPFPQQSKSLNPFDVNESSPVQATTFPSMAPLQRALANMETSPGIQRPSSLATPSPTWIAPQLSNPLAIPQGPSYGSAMPSGPFVGQVPANMPPAPRPQGGGFGYDSTAFGPFNPSQQQSGMFSAPAATPNTFSSNPFG